MAKRKTTVKKEDNMMHMHYHSKPAMVVAGIITIGIGLWAWMYNPELVKLISVLLIIMGIKKLLMAAKPCC
ncbi:MAG: hypothetical protein PHF86_11985 [Candidatus Nanoarchaeia archaeon]|nr:hypothetical protein [Candidatus Nanoarchaeia archaeon]